jgi:hypothetical protein
MRPTKAPLFATDCLGATITHVQVFPTHITYEQKLWREITVAADMIASVEQQVYEHAYVILRTTSRRRIICMVRRKQAEALCAAIRNHLLSVEHQRQLSSARHYDQ